MSKKDNQHFVQRAYLKGFATDVRPGELWEYDKETKTISDTPKSTRDICSLYQYYAAPGEDGGIDPEVIENALHVVENPFIRILRTIQPENDGEQITLTDEQFADFAYYVGMQFSRVPMLRSKIKDFMDRVVNAAKQARVNSSIKAQTSEEFRKSYESNTNGKIEHKEWATIEHMTASAEQMTNSLLKKAWTFLVPHEDIPLVISDNPVRFCSADPDHKTSIFGIGPAGDDTMVLMPLRKDLAVMILPCNRAGITNDEEYEAGNLRVKFLDKGQTKDFNKETAKNAMRYVYNGTENEKLGNMIFKFKPKQP